MKKFVIAAAAIAALAAAAPASAQSWRGDRYDHRYERDYGRGWDDVSAYQDRIERRIYSGERSGRLSYREAGRMRAEFGHIVRLEAYYRRNGLDAWERRDLLRRLDRLDTLLTAELRDRNDYRG